MTTILHLAAIVAAEDLKTQDVDCPEWGGAVRMRMMTAAQRDALGAALFDIESGAARAGITRREVLKASIIDETGALMLATDDDYAQLLAKSPAVVDRLFLAALELNAMTTAAGERLKND